MRLLEETTLTWTSSEKLSGTSTVVLISGGNAAKTTSTSNAVTMTTPTTGRFYAKQANAPFNATTTGIYGIQIKNVDLASNSTVSGITKVTDEDVNRYGRDTITLTLVEEGIYLADFSKNGNN